MRPGVRNTLIGIGTFVVPIALGILLVGPAPPAGRTSESATRVGHKALFALFDGLGYDVHRFERGLESLPDERAVLVALEPGPSFLRESGRYAGPLARWLSDGHAALLTLGPDPDHSAEVDDRDQLFGESAKKAIAYAKSVEWNARERARKENERDHAADDHNVPTKSTDRAPKPDLEDGGPEQSLLGRIEPWDSWAVEHLAAFIGVPILDQRLGDLTLSRTGTLSGVLADGIGQPATLRMTRPRTFRILPIKERGSSSADASSNFSNPSVLLSAEGDPILIELEIGRGKLMLLSEPRLFQNGAIERAAHARLAVRALERLTDHAHTKRVYFEEFSHGAREAGNILDLAFGPRARWVSLQIVLVAIGWVLLVAFRRRSVVAREVPPRRSRHEVIDAMASLYLRSGDTAGAAQRLNTLSRLRTARMLGLGAHAVSIDELATAMALRVDSRRAEELRSCLAEGAPSSRRALVERAQRLRALRVDVDGRK